MKIEKLLVNDKITALCQTNIPPKHHFKCNKQQKMNFEKFRLTSFSKLNHKCIPFQSSSSLSIRVSFCICSIIFTFFYVLSSFSHVLPSLHCWLFSLFEFCEISWHGSFNNNKFLDLFFLLRDGLLEKLWGGGEEFSRHRNFFSLSNSLYEFFLGHSMNNFHD